MMKLQAREIGTALSGQGHLAGHVEPAHERYPWLDSSLDLERGLDVLELSIDLLLPDLPGPPHAARQRSEP